MRALLTGSCWITAVAVIAAPIAVVWPKPACADTWVLPSTTTYLSPGGCHRLTVVPRELTDHLSYFTDSVRDKEKPGQRPGARDAAKAILERRGSAGEWKLVWETSLINDVAPADAIVSDSGDYVATFDNWHSLGWGKDAVVIYDRGGKLVRAMALTDFLPEDWFLTLPRSVSSIWWGGTHRFENGQLVLQIAYPNASQDDQKYAEIAIDPATGKQVPRDATIWRQALAIAKREAIPVRAAQAAHLAMLRAPLKAPDGFRDKRTLHWYLTEAFERLDPEWKTGYPGTQVLDRPGGKSYAGSLKSLSDALSREPLGEALAIASYDPADLANALVAEAAQAEIGALKGVRVYATISDQDSGRVAAALTRLGAIFVQLDPAETIPQRPERMPNPDGSLPDS